MENADRPINPINEIDYNETIIQGNTIYRNQEYGLSKREYFAGLAMQALINNVNSPNFIAEKAVKLADELLQKLENK